MTKESQGFLNFILLKCRWFTVLSWFLVYSKVILSHTCVFFHILSHSGFCCGRRSGFLTRSGIATQVVAPAWAWATPCCNCPGGATLTRGHTGAPCRHPKGWSCLPCPSQSPPGFLGVESSAASHYTHYFSHPLPTISGLLSLGSRSLPEAYSVLLFQTCLQPSFLIRVSAEHSRNS